MASHGFFSEVGLKRPVAEFLLQVDQDCHGMCDACAARDPKCVRSWLPACAATVHPLPGTQRTARTARVPPKHLTPLVSQADAVRVLVFVLVCSFYELLVQMISHYFCEQSSTDHCRASAAWHSGHKWLFGPTFSYTFCIELFLAPIESGPLDFAVESPAAVNILHTKSYYGYTVHKYCDSKTLVPTL